MEAFFDIYFETYSRGIFCKVVGDKSQLSVMGVKEAEKLMATIHVLCQHSEKIQG